jgi:carbon-monoxide dehydrogenase small subunit
MQKIQFSVNGRSVAVEAPARATLVEVLREQLGLTGTHVGCDTSQCGACTVHMDGRAVKSCAVLIAQAQGAQIRTIEGMADSDGTMHRLQQAFIDNHGLQCGFCTPGMIMAAADLLSHTPKPTDAQIMHALEGNLCRCTGYVNIVAAVRDAAGMETAR